MKRKSGGRVRKWKTCQMILAKEARFYNGVWMNERTEPCGASLTKENEQIKGLCDLCCEGGQALLGHVAKETPQQTMDRIFSTKVPRKKAS